MEKTDFVVRFAGEGGQGVVTSAELLVQVTAQVGYHAQTFSTFPSQIMGGPTWAQSRISVQPVLSSGDSLDVLVAFNRDAYDTHHDDVKEGGVIVYNSEEFELDDDGASLGIRVDELAKSTGNARAANMVILGAIAHLVNMPENYLPDFVTKRFTRGRAGDAEIINANIQALTLGRDAARASGFSLGNLAPPQPADVPQLLVKGNDALSLGALAAGLEFYMGYPITPATTIFSFMQRNLLGPGKFAYQASSEIEAIGAAIGAGYAGRKSMTATSGPGLSLMSEGLGMGWIMEIPVVVVNVQRGGPATGMPTKTEQPDLFGSLHASHGDAAFPVIAPGTVEECFYAAIAAINWAERYQGPVILLSEQILSERAQNIPKPDLSKVVSENRSVYTGENGYKRYEAHEISPMPVPGTPGSYVANASEHDPVGDTTHLPIRHVEMTERRFSKLKLLEDGDYEIEGAEEPIAIMPWGGTKGPAREAYTAMKEQGQKVGWLYTMYIHPLPAKLLAELRKKKLVLVPELNYQGQFASVLRSHGVNAHAITQYNGMAFKSVDLVTRMTETIAAQKKELVQV